MIAARNPRSRLPSAAPIAGALLAVVLAALPPGATPAAAKDDGFWNVDEKLYGEPKGAKIEDSKKSEDVSGIACDRDSGFPRLCLVVDDDTQGAQVVILTDGELLAGDFIRLIRDTYTDEKKHKEKLLELDAEGVAFAGGAFYVMGSHGRPRDDEEKSAAEIAARAKAASWVFRIRFKPDAVDMVTGKIRTFPEITPSGDLPRLIGAYRELAAKPDTPLKEGGLTIEGIAVRGGCLKAGLRAPVLGQGAALLAVPLKEMFPEPISAGPACAGGLTPIDLGKDTLGNPRGLRDVVEYEGRLLLLAGPEVDPPDDHAVAMGDYAIVVFADGKKIKSVDLKDYGPKFKPEALLPLDEKGGKLRLLVLFDGAEEGKPHPVKIDWP